MTAYLVLNFNLGASEPLVQLWLVLLVMIRKKERKENTVPLGFYNEQLEV